MFAARPIGFLAWAAMAALGAAPALAQQPAAPAAAAAIAPVIVIVDVQQILRDSLVAKDVQGQMSQRTDRYTKEVAAQENDLQHTQEDLEKQRTVLSPEAFNNKMRDFQQRYDALDQGVQATRQSLQKAYNDAMSKVENTALQIIADVAAERKANLVISKAAVLFEEPAFDITQDVIHRLDAKLPAVSLNLPPPAAPGSPRSAPVVGPRTNSPLTRSPALLPAPAPQK